MGWNYDNSTTWIRGWSSIGIYNDNNNQQQPTTTTTTLLKENINRNVVLPGPLERSFFGNFLMPTNWSYLDDSPDILRCHSCRQTLRIAGGFKPAWKICSSNWIIFCSSKIRTKHRHLTQKKRRNLSDPICRRFRAAFFTWSSMTKVESGPP